MAIKLFPHLQRISIKEHAKSHNYEDYIGVVLDKKNNNFKVVEGQFTDKKDMYRKMKARGLILRKAYERKVWEWIAENADGPIISYLMLSTAFSKWRSNNVLHKYYQKLLNDIPELNREREKGNPNTRGGDFITTDDEDAPKREESVELDEADDDEYTKQTYTVQLLGIPYGSEKEEPIVSNYTSDKDGKFTLTSSFWFNTNHVLKNPQIIEIVDDLMNTDNSSTITGIKTKDKYKQIKVLLNDKLERVYDKNAIEVDVRELHTGKINYEKSATSHIVNSANTKIRELFNKLEDKNLTDEEKKKIEDEISFLRTQRHLAKAEKHVDINNLRHTWQSKVAHDLGHDSDEIRQQLANNDEFNKFMVRLIAVNGEKEDFDQYINSALKDDEGFAKLNKSFGFVDFDPLSKEQLKDVYNKIKSGESIAEDEKERKSILHNLIWYVLADGRKFKQSEQAFEKERLGINRANRTSDLIQKLQSTGLSGFNHKTQSGKANADAQVGDLKRIRNELNRLAKEPIYAEPHDRKITTPFDKNGLLELKMKGLSRKINNIDKQLNNSSLSGKEKSKLISDRNALEKEYKSVSNEYNKENPVDKSKIYSSNGEDVKTLDPKDSNVSKSYKTDRYEIPKKESVNITQYDNDGATLMHRYSPYQGKGFDYSAGPIKMTGQIVEDTTKTELNPKLFENDVLIPEVRDALYKIATVFKDYLDLPFEIKDIYFTGSNANYNYNEDSDIDLHLVYDFEQAGVNAELLSKYLVAAKKDFNDKYDIKVKGMPVELGCENVNEPLVSTGVYSLGANTWVIKPENSGIEIPDVDMNAFNDLSTQIDDTIKDQNASAIKNLWKKIKELRKDSLSNEGEFGMGNLLFKKLRNTDYLEKLRNKMYDTQSKELSLESSETFDEAELNDKRDCSEYLKDLKDELNTKDTQDLLCDRSLINYLDGYKDRNEKTEPKEENGMLNEDIPLWKLHRAETHLMNGVSPQAVEGIVFTDLDGTLCKFIATPETNKEPEHLYKIPVRRREVADGVYRFIGNKEEAKEIGLDEFQTIIDSPINRKKHKQTSVNMDIEDQMDLVHSKILDQRREFEQWYDDHEESLDLNNHFKKGREKPNSTLRQMYKLSRTGFSDREIKDYFSDLYKEDPEKEITEDTGDKLNITKDTNTIRDILIAVNTNDKDPLFLAKYVTRPIYQNLKQRNKKTFEWDDLQKHWQITGMDDVSKYLKDGKFDFTKMPADKIHINLVNTAPDASRDRMTLNLNELKRLINSCEDNDPEVDNPKMDADIYNSKRPYRQQISKTYTRRRLTDYEVKSAIEYVKSDEYKQKVSAKIEELTRLLKNLDPKSETDKKAYYEYNRMLRDEKFKLLLSNTKQRTIDTIIYLNAVEDGVHIESGRDGYYIKLPLEGFTYQDIKNRGDYQPDDLVKRLSSWSK